MQDRNKYGMKVLRGSELPYPKRMRAHLRHVAELKKEIDGVDDLRSRLKEKPSRTRRKYGEIIEEIDQAIHDLAEARESIFNALYRFKDPQ